jgi:cell division protein FtsI/penicillin-binding protein 2
VRDAGRGRVVGLAVLAVVAIAALVGAAVLVLGGDDDGGGPRDARAETPEEEAVLAAAERFAAAVEAGTVDPEWTSATEGLSGLAVSVTPGAVAHTGTTATVPLDVEWTVSGASWASSGTLALAQAGTAWTPTWDLAALDRRLRPGDVLTVEATPPDRAAILDGAGQPLVAPTPVVHVGVQPSRTTDVDGLVAQLQAILQDLVELDTAALAARIRAAQPDAFVDVVTLRDADYQPRRAQLQPLPGTVFATDTALLAPSRSFARAVLGTVGPATAEQVEASEGRLAAGDVTGQSGLQEVYDEQLRGTPGLVVTVARATSASAPAGEGETIPLATVPATPGAPVRTTLDVAAQEAAEAALAGESRVSALVAVRASTGEVLAMANGPTGTGNNVGATAQVPPGSTFKVVSTLAHLRKGLTVDQVVPCPQTISVGGREFGNAGDFALGDVPFSTDFARSCNTAFAGLSGDLAPDDLAAAGRAFGLGVEVDVGIPTYAGSVPPTEGGPDAAAASIGQGRLLTSPLSMAQVAATVAAGSWRPPRFVVEPAPAGERPADVPLPEAETLRALMRGVVTSGTGDALLGVPGGDVFAKTGTAEFGTESPPQTHAWVIGFQGDIAFAVFVEGGEGGGAVAAPIAASFLTALAG